MRKFTMALIAFCLFATLSSNIVSADDPQCNSKVPDSSTPCTTITTCPDYAGNSTNCTSANYDVLSYATQCGPTDTKGAYCESQKILKGTKCSTIYQCDVNMGTNPWSCVKSQKLNDTTFGADTNCTGTRNCALPPLGGS